MTPAALEWVAAFRRHLAIERRLSPHTDSNYARDLGALVTYCDRQKIAEWSALDSQHVRTFAAHSHAAGLAPRSIQRRLSAVRSFCNYLVRERALPANPGYEIRAPKAGRRLPHTLDADQMARLLDVPPGDALVARDHALMELLYSSGLRLAELVGLDLLDLDLADRTVRLLGKGNKSRIVPVGKHAVQALERWLATRATFVKPAEMAVFIGRNGRRLGGRAAKALAYPFIRTSSAIPSPRICLNPVANFVACRSFWAMRTSPRPRFIPTLTSNTSPAFTTVPTLEHARKADQFRNERQFKI